MLTAFSVATSPDNKSVYAASPNGVIYAFSRDEQTGVITQVNTLGGVTTSGFVSVSVSPNGKFVYGVGGQPDGLVVFSRDPNTSTITRIADYADNTNGYSLGQAFSPSLSPIKNIVSSADGQRLYVTSTDDNAVSLFNQDQTTGLLTLQAVYVDGQNGFDGLQGASSAKMSPDGKYLYVTGQGENSVAILAINNTTGALTYVGKVTQGVNGISSLFGARSLAISPDGRYVLVSAINSSTVTAFSRNANTGLLTLDSVASNGVNSVTGLTSPSGMATDPLNRHLYVSAQTAKSLVVFSLPTPAVQLSATQASAVVSGPAVVLDNQLEVYDSDSPNLASATVSISEGFINTDLLSVATTNGITPSYSASTGVLTLIGSASLADYKATLRSLSYQAGADASLSPGQLSSRKISIDVTDGDGNQGAAVFVAVSVQMPNGFPVTFVDWDGTTLASQTVPSGGSAIAPTPLSSRTGYTFTGWDVTFGNITAATTVTAQYTVNSYTVTFNLDGGTRTSGGALVQTVNYGQAAVAPVFTAPAGQTFSGWNATFNSITANTTVTAQYSINSYSVTFDLNGGTSTGGGALVQSVVYGGAAVAPMISAPLGKTFSGWSTSFNNITAITSVTAQYTINSYTVTFNLDGGTSTGGGALVQTVNYAQAAVEPAFTTPAGKTFTGWSTTFNSVTANTTVMAQYSVNTYSVTFDLNGGTSIGGGTLVQTVIYGDAAVAPTVSAPLGKTFSGWSTGFDNITAITTVTAQYTVNSYTVTFNLNGGTSTGGGALVQTVNYGQAAVEPAFTTPAGKTFTGWSTTFNSVTANTTVTAQYSANTYSVTFDLNGGTSIGGGTLVQTVIYGDAAVAPMVSAPLGKIFSGWSTGFDSVMGNITVIAQYGNLNYTVTATVNGQASLTPATQQVQSGTTAHIIVSLVRADDTIKVSSNCNAMISGNQITTSSITANCAISVSVYATTKVTRESETPLAINVASRFSLVGGEGAKTLSGVMLKRSGEEVIMEDAAGKAVVSLQSDGSYLFSASRTGRYSLVFVDTVSNESVTVVYDVLPYIAFTSSKQPAQQNTATSLRIWLSDEPIEYPVVVNFAATGATVSAEQFELTAADNLRRSYEVTATAGTASVALKKDELVSAIVGTPSVQTLAVQQLLPPLALNVSAMQNSQHDSVVTKTGGAVALNVSELNSGTATYTWSATGLVLTSSGASTSFDPSVAPEGIYTVTVQAVASDGRTGRYDFALRVIASCSFENCAGTGTSGIPVAANSFAATPNRLAVCPVGASSRVANCPASASLYAEVPNQYALALGSLSGDQSWASGQFGIAVNDKSLADAGFTQLSPVVNFDVTGLDHAGEAVPVAIPLPLGVVIPKNAIWRKYINSKWQNFVVNADNKLHSAARNALGACPGVSSDMWAEGLIVGRDCVRLTIEDGGPNDADGLANGTVRDPGALAVAVTPEPPVVVPPVDPVVKDAKVKSGGGSIDIVTLLLLGALCLIRFRKVWAILLLLPLPALAQNIYIGAEGLAAKTSVSSSGVTNKLSSAGLTGSAKVDDSSRNGWRLYAGLSLNNSWSLEVGWLDLGDITTSYSGVPVSASADELRSMSPQSGSGLDVSARWKITDQFEKFKPSLKAGIWRMGTKDHYVDDVGRSHGSDNDYVPFVGVDAEWLLVEHWSAKLGASHYKTEDYGTTTVNLGLVYSF